MAKREIQTIGADEVGRLENIVSGVGASSVVSPLNPGGKDRAKAIQDAMSAAVTECYAKGITDAAEHKKAMMAARDVVKANWRG